VSKHSWLSPIQRPTAPAFFDGNSGRWFSRAELQARIEVFADSLRFRQKAFGFVFPSNDADSLTAYLAAMEAGHAIAALNPELDAVLRSDLIRRFQPDFIVAPAPKPDEEHWSCGGLYGEPLPLGDGLLLWKSTDPHRYAVHPELTLLISTSGSTGSPKLVRLSSRNLRSNAEQINIALGNSELDTAMITTPIFNQYAQSVVHTNLLAGGSFALTRERLVSRSFWNTVRDAECNSIGGTPYFYQVLDRLDLDSLQAPRLKKFVQTGGRLPEELAGKFHAMLAKRGGTLHLMYGQGEATARISGLPPELLPELARSIGFPLSGGRLRVERAGRPCKSMEEGELIYEGPNVMMGYATAPEDLGKGDLLSGTLATGDLGYQDDRGLFYITGRSARFAKVFGWRVSLDDVEEMLTSHGLAVAAATEGDRILIFHEGVSHESASSAFGHRVAETAARLRLHPSGFEVHAVERIPRFPNGKTDYRTLVHRCRSIR
jgi:acyl-CoA synthetase (AMP-forming)/AMP-acid ligase II